VIDEPGRFPAEARITRPSDFQQVFASRLRSTDDKFQMIARQNGLGRARLGCAFSKRWSPTAVARNRLKRIVRESFQRHYSALGDLDIVVMARRDLRATANPELRDSLEGLWKKIAACVRS